MMQHTRLYGIDECNLAEYRCAFRMVFTVCFTAERVNISGSEQWKEKKPEFVTQYGGQSERKR